MNRFLSNVVTLSALFVLPLVSSAEAAKPKAKLKPISWAKVERELRKEGLSSKFVKTLRKNYRVDHREKVLSLNILSFLGTPHHAKLVTDEAVERTRAFMQMQKGDLEEAEKKYGVPGSIIASLLWIETRHGSLTGSFHVPSVYLTLYLSKGQSERTYLQKLAMKHPNRTLASSDLETKIMERVVRKSDWALGQLKTLDKLHRKGSTLVRTLKGSFAGAFGIPQFIPDSYARWAVSSSKKRQPDLYRMDDAVLSVANYLKTNGWKDDPESRMKALMHYNNSTDYAEAILELSRRALVVADAI